MGKEGDSMARTKTAGETFKCEECGTVVRVKESSTKTPTADLTCCEQPMKKIA